MYGGVIHDVLRFGFFLWFSIKCLQKKSKKKSSRTHVHAIAMLFNRFKPGFFFLVFFLCNCLSGTRLIIIIIIIVMTFQTFFLFNSAVQIII